MRDICNRVLRDLRHNHLPNYLDHCEWSFARYGVRASGWLSTPEHFRKWEERYFKDGPRTNKACCRSTLGDSAGVERGGQHGSHCELTISH